MSLFGDGLDAAVQKAFTRPAPKSAPAQMRYLVKQLKSTKAVAQMLRISQRTVERYVKDQIKKPRPDLAARLEREVK
ncbi:telomere-protecting terminal protein Tpg, partial [Streptomyces sp. NPDC056291]